MRLRRGTRRERNGAPLHSEGSGHSCRVFALGVVYFKPVVEFYELSLWLPAMIKSSGLSSMQTGVLCVLWTRQSDTTSKRRLHMVLPCVVGAIRSAHGRRHSLADGVFPVANRRRLQHLPIASMLLAVAHSNDDRLGGRWRRRGHQRDRRSRTICRSPFGWPGEGFDRDIHRWALPAGSRRGDRNFAWTRLAAGAESARLRHRECDGENTSKHLVLIVGHEERWSAPPEPEPARNHQTSTGTFADRFFAQ